MRLLETPNTLHSLLHKAAVISRELALLNRDIDSFYDKNYLDIIDYDNEETLDIVDADYGANYVIIDKKVKDKSTKRLIIKTFERLHELSRQLRKLNQQIRDAGGKK